MGPWIARKAWRRIPWKMVVTVALWLAEKGSERVRANLSQAEQREFWTLLKKSRGRPSALSERDRTRIKTIVGKAIKG